MLPKKSLGKASALPRFFVQPDEKSYFAIRTPKLCGIALRDAFASLFVLNAFLNRIESALFDPADLSLRYSDFCRGFHLGFAAEKPQR